MWLILMVAFCLGYSNRVFCVASSILPVLLLSKLSSLALSEKVARRILMNNELTHRHAHMV